MRFSYYILTIILNHNKWLNKPETCFLIFILKSQYCTCGQSLKYDKNLDSNCNSGCSGNTYNYVEYCGGGNLVSVHATGRWNVFIC